MTNQSAFRLLLLLVINTVVHSMTIAKALDPHYILMYITLRWHFHHDMFRSELAAKRST